MKNPKLDPKNMPADVVGWVCLGVAWVCLGIGVLVDKPAFAILMSGLLLFTLVGLSASVIALTQKKYLAGLIQLLLSPLAGIFYLMFWKWLHNDL